MNQKLRLLRLAPSSSITNIYDKFKSLDLFEEVDKIDGFSEFHIRMTADGTFNGSVKLKDDFLLVENFSYFRLLKWIKIFFRAIFYIVKYRINMVHSNDIFFYGLAVIFAAKITKRPISISLHADYDKREKLGEKMYPYRWRWLYKICEKINYKLALKVIATQKSWTNYLVNNGCKKEKIEYIPHTIDTENFQNKKNIDIRKMFNIEKKSNLISYVGRFETGNYIDDIIKIAIDISLKHNDIIFVIAGKGNFYERARKMVEEKNLKKQILLPGFVSNDCAVSLRKKSQVNLALMGGPSLLEAMLSGVPTIAYDVEWHHEIIKHGHTGYLIQERNVNEVINTINKILESPEKSKKIGINAINLVNKTHSLKAAQKKRKELYQKLMEKTT